MLLVPWTSVDKFLSGNKLRRQSFACITGVGCVILVMLLAGYSKRNFALISLGPSRACPLDVHAS